MILTLSQLITSNGKHQNFVKDWGESKNIEELIKNGNITIAKISEFFSRLGVNVYGITSGYRPAWHNKAIGGAEKSSHLFAQAIDFLDLDKSLGKICIENMEAMKEIGLHMESLVGLPDEKKYGTHNTPFKDPWVHLTTRSPKSGAVVFIP